MKVLRWYGTKELSAPQRELRVLLERCQEHEWLAKLDNEFAKTMFSSISALVNQRDNKTTASGDAKTRLDFLETISSRHCTRSFLATPVPIDVLEQALATAGSAPSSQNEQPWRVSIIMGEALKRVKELMLETFDKLPPEPELGYRSRPLDEHLPLEWKANYEQYGRELYGHLKIAQTDKDARRIWRRKNFNCYGAPCLIMLHVPLCATEGTFLGAGIFLQNLILALQSCGLGTCPQLSVAKMVQHLAGNIGLEEDCIYVVGCAVGYSDLNAFENKLQMSRLPVQKWVRWFQ